MFREIGMGLPYWEAPNGRMSDVESHMDLKTADLMELVGNFQPTVPASPEEKSIALSRALRQELKCKAKLNLHRRGLSESFEEEKRPRVNGPLTPREVEKRERRKRQNREAAARCREKKLKGQAELHRDFEAQQLENEQLKRTNAELLEEKLRLQSIIENHVCFKTGHPAPINSSPGYASTVQFDFQHCDGAPPSVSPIQTSAMTSPYAREVTTPFQQDPFADQNLDDNVFGEFYSLLNPGKKQMESSCASATSVLNALPELPNLDSLTDIDFYNPISPEEIGCMGRGSISEYRELKD
ncbi:protein c-Fos-like isoform X1 [Mya arenaria]|uniref:protein c-Fos-like isoform X1 n=2 Tax=Mya arenaria TaxID=6604 RepID=UPI0022E1C760|nr:protein c-Fos-like isoform X1 [Mya arenaria]